MKSQPVHQGRLKSPFYSRLEKLDFVNEWHPWAGYTCPNELYCADTEYFAIRNATSVFDLTPMTKYRITGPDALDYLNRLVTRDMAKIRPGRVAYAVWCDDQGKVIDDGTIFHLREGEYRLCSQERHFAWLQAAAIGFDVSITHETEDVAALAVDEQTHGVELLLDRGEPQLLGAQRLLRDEALRDEAARLALQARARELALLREVDGAHDEIEGSLGVEGVRGGEVVPPAARRDAARARGEAVLRDGVPARRLAASASG